MNNTVNISLQEIIKRKMSYCQKDSDVERFQTNKGYIRGFEEILEDMSMAETEFIDKYSEILSKLDTIFEETNYEENMDYIEELSGYNNAIVDVLYLLNEAYMYDEEFLK